VALVHVPADGKPLFQPPYFFQHAVISQEEVPQQTRVVRDEDSNQFVITPGAKPANEPSIIPFRYSTDLFGELLADTLNIPVQELNLPIPGHAKVFYSIPADSAYRVMMQESDNFIAEQLLLACAGVVADSLRPEAAIRYAKEKLLTDLPDEPRWVDGSGLSRYNLMTPRSIVRLWEKLYQEIPTSRLFPLLATGGKNGTLHSFFKAEKPYVFGKTGSLSNNHSLSGFLITRKQRILIFSIMCNNFVKPNRQLRLRMEQIIKLIHENY
jgi:D-alanyl-D-alanine carboxypeptidase/D-alanyl-D-alanine-endopeptidase (penicillin-binding protein 4)